MWLLSMKVDILFDSVQACERHLLIRTFIPYFCVQLRPTSIEKEIFPVMAEEGHLYAMELQGNYHCSSREPGVSFLRICMLCDFHQYIC